MGEEKNKNLLLTFLVILLLLVLGLGGYITYDKLLAKEENKTIDSKNNNTLLYNYNLTKRTTVQAISEGYIDVLVDTEGNAYLTINGNLDYENDTQLKTNIQNIEKQFQTYSPKGYTYHDGSTELKAYKLNISDVLSTYYVHMGNSGSSYFVFIKENGKLSYLSYDKLIYNGEISLKNIDNLENIVSIVENTYSMTPYAVNLNGNEISLYDYIK